MPEFKRRDLTPAEFADRCTRLEELRPDLSQTSGRRSESRNAAVGGSPRSQHLEPGSARDYVADGMPWSGPDGAAEIRILEDQAKTLGLWGMVHGDGSNQHLHVQRRAPQR